jgi:hypothetical protein
MAAINQQEQQRLTLLGEIEQAEKRINAQNEKIAVSKSKEAKRLTKMMEDEKKSLETLKEELKVTDKLLASNKKRAETLKKQAQFKKEIAEDSENELTSFSKLSNRVKTALSSEKTGYSGLASVTARIREINTQILLVKTDGRRMTEADKEAARAKLGKLIEEKNTLRTNRDLLLQQVESYLGVKEYASEAEKQRSEELDFRQSIAEFDEETKKALSGMYQQRKNFLAQEQRIKQIQERADAVYDAMPGKIGELIKAAKGFAEVAGKIGLLWATIAAVLAIVVSEFTDLSAAASDFRKETGVLNSQMKGVAESVQQSRMEMAALGVDAKDIFNVIKEYKTQFSELYEPTKDVRDALTVMSANFGISAESSAEVLSIMQGMSDISDETATAFMLQATQVAKIAHIAPKKVFEDIKNASERIAKFMGDSADEIFKAELGARQLGMNLDDVLATTEHLLDFEGNIGEELKANAMLYGQFSLTQARILAASGDEIGAQKEVNRQLNRGVEFSKKKYYEKEALAKALGTTVGKLQHQLMLEKKLQGLNDDDRRIMNEAIANGLDINGLDEKGLKTALAKAKADKEINGQLTQTLDSFKAIGAELGTTLMPIIDGLVSGLKGVNLILSGIRWVVSGIVGFFKDIVGASSEVSEGMRPVINMMKAAAGAAVVWAAMSAYAGVAAMLASSVVAAPMIPIIAGAAAAATLTAGMGFVNSVGDLNKPAGEGPIVSTREGGIFQGTKNDDVAMGPGISSKLAGGGALSSNSNNNQIGAVLNSVNTLMQKLTTGGIVAYASMDGKKLNSGLLNIQSKGTRNTLGL